MIIEELPEDDEFRIIDDMPKPADSVDLLAWFMSVALNYTEACRRIAMNEGSGLTLLMGTYNGTVETIKQVANTAVALMEERGFHPTL